jgi:hypothetical protein
MEYSLTVKRLRMKAVSDSIDGGNGPGSIQLRDPNRVILCTLILTKPSFYLVGPDLQLVSPTTGFVTVRGDARIGTIMDGTGNIIIDEMTVGTDLTDDDVHDFEIVLDTTVLEVGKQVTIVSATITHD